MRLLKKTDCDELELVEFLPGTAPRYAILSHTWGDDEVLFQDLVDSDRARCKAGYAKIAFCGEQAARDGLEYFWVDTCCIDKASSAELQESINSMFRWYRDAAVCYVYLADVSGPLSSSSSHAWEAAFQRSRWFTRGWTLQELIAPTAVEFFSNEGVRLGSRASLDHWICEITGIPTRALQAGVDLSIFTVDERMAWTRGRVTTREEDMAYALLGIFDVHMPLIYSEGRTRALRRLQDEIERDTQGPRHADFAVPFRLPATAGVERFVARGNELDELHERLRSNGSRRVAVLHGLGGVGKTQLAIAYAKRHKESYSAVFWLNAKDKASIQQSFVKVAMQIEQAHPHRAIAGGGTERNAAADVNAVCEWLGLRDNTRWLLIYDNYDNPVLPGDRVDDPEALSLGDFLPDADQGAVVVTTRVSRLDLGHRIHVQKLGLDDSLAILATASRRDGVADDADAIALAKELDGLPLALATAGTYLDQTAATFQDYIRLYRSSWSALLKTSPGLSMYDRSLYSTWQLSYDNVQRQNPLAADLLRLWAFFDNQDLWYELLRHDSWDTTFPEWGPRLGDELEFNNAARVLVSYGLIEADTSSALPPEEQKYVGSRGYSMHACLHAYALNVLNFEAGDFRGWLFYAMACVAFHVVRDDAPYWWLVQRRLRGHATRCLMFTRSSNSGIDGHIFMCLHNLAGLYADQGANGTAIELYRRAVQASEKVLGPDHHTTVIAVNNLANALDNERQDDEAEQLYLRALQAAEGLPDLDGRTTWSLLHNFGSLYHRQGKLDKAEALYLRALGGKDRAFGPNNATTMGTVGNIGILYMDQNKLVEAEAMLQRALHYNESLFGAAHTQTLEAKVNLGILYAKQGNLDAAEAAFLQAREGMQATLPPENLVHYQPALHVLRNLGNVYQKQGRWADAAAVYAEAMVSCKLLYGQDSPMARDYENEIEFLHRRIASEDGQETADGEAKAPGDGEAKAPGDGEAKAPGDGETKAPGDGEAKVPGGGDQKASRWKRFLEKPRAHWKHGGSHKDSA